MSDSSSLPSVVRRARASDYEHYARLFPALGLAEEPPGQEAWTVGCMARALFLEVPEAEAPVGYAFYDLQPTCGYVRNVMLADGHRRRGHGTTLMNALADIFREAGCGEWRLNVERDNQAALALYKGCGMGVAYETYALYLPFAIASEEPLPTGELRVLSLPPERDSAVEALFAMPQGLMTSLRNRPGTYLLQLVDESRSPAECLGVTRFTPAMPGAFPFRLRAPHLVGPMLAAMRALTPDDVESLTLTCEDDPELVEYLRARGAEVRMELFHMRGDLP